MPRALCIRSPLRSRQSSPPLLPRFLSLSLTLPLSNSRAGQKQLNTIAITLTSIRILCFACNKEERISSSRDRPDVVESDAECARLSAIGDGSRALLSGPHVSLDRANSLRPIIHDPHFEDIFLANRYRASSNRPSVSSHTRQLSPPPRRYRADDKRVPRWRAVRDT